MIHRYATFIKAANLIVDYILLNASMFAAYFVIANLQNETTSGHNYLPISVVFNLLWFFSANVSGLYTGVLNKDAIVTYRNLFRTYLLFAGLVCITVFIIGIKAYFITRNFLWFAILIFGGLLILWKLVFLAIRKGDRHLLVTKRNIAIVGAGRVGTDLYEYLKQNPDRGYNIVGFFDDDPDKGVGAIQILGDVASCIPSAATYKLHEIFCALPISEIGVINQLMYEADKAMVRFRLVPEYFNFKNRTTIVQSFGSIPVISLRPEPLENMINRIFKRIFDVCFSLFVIIFILSWLTPLLALIIKIQSKGPVFFAQWRSGLDNQNFKCYKFRSMHCSTDANTMQATRNDVRLTPIGKFLRKTNLDELPQFFNVLVGEMSVVGPRPHMLAHTQHYAKEIERYMVRHFVQPGVTGWAQVRGYRGETKDPLAMEKRIEHDVWYLENWSFLLDMKIIFLTFWITIIGDDNAY